MIKEVCRQGFVLKRLNLVRVPLTIVVRRVFCISVNKIGIERAGERGANPRDNGDGDELIFANAL